MRAPAIFLACAILLGGCSTYEYDVRQPGSIAQPVTHDQPVRFNIDPLEYRTAEVDGRLEMEIFNPTSDAIDLKGGTIVDPVGGVHAIKASTISSLGILTVSMPPTGTTEELPAPTPPPPRTGMGPTDQPGYIQPQGYSTPPSKSAEQWEWSGEGDVQIHLDFSRSGKSFSQDFTFHRARK